MPKLQATTVCRWPETQALFDRLGVDWRGCRRVELILDVNDAVSVKTHRLDLADKGNGAECGEEHYREFDEHGNDVTSLAK